MSFTPRRRYLPNFIRWQNCINYLCPIRKQSSKICLESVCPSSRRMKEKKNNSKQPYRKWMKKPERNFDENDDLKEIKGITKSSQLGPSTVKEFIGYPARPSKFGSRQIQKATVTQSIQKMKKMNSRRINLILQTIHPNNLIWSIVKHLLTFSEEDVI